MPDIPPILLVAAALALLVLALAFYDRDSRG